MVGALLLLFAVLLASRGWSTGPVAAELPAQGHGNAAAIGKVLYSRFLFPFEITSMLLLVAMVGAIVLIKGRGPSDAEAA
jgi:NADH-quinone oxidoreductase subunit J